MGKIDKILILYGIFFGIIGNILEIKYAPQGQYFLTEFTIKLIILWCIISSIHLFLELKREKNLRNYRKVLELFIVGISISMVLIGTLGLYMFLIVTYPMSWIRIVPLAFSIPHIVYFLKKYWIYES
ncbi:MAG: hypothetical protein ACK5MV_04245 [Aminipila sp.]